MYRLQACPCIFQPGDFTGLGSEGVKEALLEWLVGTVSRVAVCSAVLLLISSHVTASSLWWPYNLL